ncbi:MAG: hypothetical protein HKP45_08020, partial [Winogradskyella sp.]|nr:hypothetical protein [Winogradskyella sp.]
LIPILIHLFQLRKFKRVEFTNVKFLKQVEQQTRKSSQLKKWLVLLTRMLLLACLVVAFAQPYFASKELFNLKKETVLYLDNSFSMQAKGKNGSLLNEAIQDIINTIEDTETINVFTNDEEFKTASFKAIKNDLINLSYSSQQYDYESVILKGKQLFSNDPSSLKQLIVVSDFQRKNENFNRSVDTALALTLVKLEPTSASNISIDSVFISNRTNEILNLNVVLSNSGRTIDETPISLFSDNALVAKSTAVVEGEGQVIFTLPANQKINGKISIEDNSLQYDNSLYFNLRTNPKIKVLAINDADDTYLKSIYTTDEFEYNSVSLNTLRYNTISDYNLVIINMLESVPTSLTTALETFKTNGGSVLIITSENSELTSYNQLLTSLKLPNLIEKNNTNKQITTINYDHPIFENTFNKRVRNFQYPYAKSSYVLASTTNAILEFEDGTAFVTGANGNYLISGAINSVNSNFIDSPLIVPLLYNIGKQSLKVSKLYYTIDNENTIDIDVVLTQDEILTLTLNSNSIIPMQKSTPTKVQLMTDEHPKLAGIYDVNRKDSTLLYLSFNYNRTESNLSYLNLEEGSNINIDNSLANAINAIKTSTKVNALWKWFVIFALVFLLIEMLILKYFK